jgi:ketosteroid isomerase-like protein
MAGRAAQQFMDGLKTMEASRDAAALLGRFADAAELESPARNARFQGVDGAREFWQGYLSAFAEIRSQFTRVAEDDDFAALEWRSEGRLADGSPVSYRGVSLLDFDAAGRVTRFCTYYDSAAFLPQGAKHSA